tara:strand:+ start:349 stop:576 length:228 start_codon:yes stop_codon:yes gene_type:complete
MEQKPKGYLKQSIILMDIMSGEDRMFYLERMWNLYFKVYEKKSIRLGKYKKSKTFVMDRKKAYDLCSQLTKIFGH